MDFLLRQKKWRVDRVEDGGGIYIYIDVNIEDITVGIIMVLMRVLIVKEEALMGERNTM